jgi:hypothetical protein
MRRIDVFGSSLEDGQTEGSLAERLILSTSAEYVSAPYSNAARRLEKQEDAIIAQRGMPGRAGACRARQPLIVVPMFLGITRFKSGRRVSGHIPNADQAS